MWLRQRVRLRLSTQTSSASNADVQKALLVPAFVISVPRRKLEQIDLLGFYGNVKEALVLVILLVA